MTSLAEPAPAPRGPHRVRIARPAHAGHAMVSDLYMVEIDDQQIYPSSVTVRLKPGHIPVVALEIPAIIENTEILALLRSEQDPDEDEPEFPGRFEEC